MTCFPNGASASCAILKKLSAERDPDAGHAQDASCQHPAGRDARAYAGGNLYALTGFQSKRRGGEEVVAGGTPCGALWQSDSIPACGGVLLKLLPADADGNDQKVFRIASFNVFYRDFNDLVVEQSKAGILESYDYPAVSGTPWWLMFVPYLVIALLVLGVWLFLISRMNGGGTPGGIVRRVRRGGG